MDCFHGVITQMHGAIGLFDSDTVADDGRYEVQDVLGFVSDRVHKQVMLNMNHD